MKKCSLAFLFSALLLSSACQRGVSEKDIIAAYEKSPPTEMGIVPGYNEPTDFEKGVGLHAAGSGDLLFISVRNRGSDSITLGPAAFRILTPEGLYKLGTEPDDLASFPAKTIKPNAKELFAARLAKIEDIASQAVVLNYPPRDELLMRVFVEPVNGARQTAQ